MHQDQHKTALITGASSGIGHAVALYLLEQGYHVISLARRIDPILSSMDHVDAHAVDFRDLKACAHTFSIIQKQHHTIDVLISAAGYGDFKHLEEYPDQAIVDLLNVNLTAHILLTKAILPAVRKAQGKMIYIGSEADHHAHKMGTIYCASKFGLRGFVKSLRLEALNRGVGVTLISPGLVRSPFYDDLHFQPGACADNAIHPEQLVQTIDTILALESNALIEELHIAPMKHVVQKK